MMVRRAWGFGCTLLGLLFPLAGQAGVVAFLDGCMVGSDVPVRLRGLGWAEIDPNAGPQGPAIAAGARSRRLWTGPHLTGHGDTFTGYAGPTSGRPFAVCWHISRPGESAAEALATLKRQYPPQEGSIETGTESLHGGFERWRIAGDRHGAVMGVSWPMQGQPEAGTGFLYVVRPVTPG